MTYHFSLHTFKMGSHRSHGRIIIYNYCSIVALLRDKIKKYAWPSIHMFNTKATIPAQYLSKNKKKLYGSYICSGCQDVSNKPKLISFEIAVCNTWLAQFWGEREIVMCIYTFSRFPISDRTLGFGLTSWHPCIAHYSPIIVPQKLTGL